MALQKCHECGNDVSSEAKTCPKCGAPVVPPPKVETKQEKVIGNIVAALIIGATIFYFASGNSDSKTDSKKAENECAAADLSCLANKGVIAAGVYCKDAVERFALHSVRWTDGTFDMKFSRFRWANEADGTITYIGDKVEFQNGFGAYSPMIYECDLAKDGKTVMAARVHEGRL